MGQIAIVIRVDDKWIRCVYDISYYCDLIKRKIGSKLYLDRYERQLLNYYFMPTQKIDLWSRFYVEQDLRWVWTKCIMKLRIGNYQPLHMSKYRMELFATICSTINARAQSSSHKQITRVIDEMHRELKQGCNEPCFGLVDYDTGALFPIEGTSKAIEWRLSENGNQPWINHCFGYIPKPRPMDDEVVGKNAVKLLVHFIDTHSFTAPIIYDWA